MPAERIGGLLAVIDAVRSADGITHPQLVQKVSLG